ncbi:hypothetical protein SGO26_27170 [Cupriavidus metallidurans]|uniref:DUF6984 family protein n=1 Tax=Cupriavidus TaxID=106589 RepID=UPI00257BC484|nr:MULTISPECIES: hypothetical protein [unclassified Cupriavidus]GMG92286.1 hypothetical protein Cmtc_35060 [Cupriavidus sp. TKC]
MSRPIEEREKILLLRLGELGNIPSVAPLLATGALSVQDMDDGGMGSFLIVLPQEYEGAKHGYNKVTAKSNDADGVLLVATLYVNERGFPCEVDIWKVDFSPIIEIPSKWELEDFPRFPGTGRGAR